MDYTARVLVIDDEQPVRVTLKEVLSREGYEVLTASSGQEALQVMGYTTVIRWFHPWTTSRRGWPV